MMRKNETQSGVVGRNNGGGANLRVEVSSDVPDWSAFLVDRSDATIYHDPRWGQVMQRGYGNRPFYLTARDEDGSVVGIAQLVLQKSLLFGTHLCSLPYFDASGILAADESAREALLDEARSLREEHRADHLELRQMEPVSDSLPTRTDKVTMWLDLPSDADALWDGLKAKVRNQVRKPTKAGMEAIRGGSELLDQFCAVYEQTMRDLGSPPHSRRFFREVLGAFGEDVSLFLVQDGEDTVASGLLLLCDGRAHLPWAASDWSRRNDCPNMLLYWEMLKFACQRQAETFDFGRSTREAGTYRFKRQWGAREIPLHWQFILPEGRSLPELRPDSAKFRFLTACWRKLPVRLARMLGPRLIAKLS
jgi:serine/alanine adding enzyme